jgi:hypothetical protein
VGPTSVPSVAGRAPLSIRAAGLFAPVEYGTALEKLSDKLKQLYCGGLRAGRTGQEAPLGHLSSVVKTTREETSSYLSIACDGLRGRVGSTRKLYRTRSGGAGGSEYGEGECGA